MRTRRVVKFRDLLQTQLRLTVLGECGHWTSISAMACAAMSPSELRDLRVSITCAHCPDEPDEKSPRQLWKDAGEP